MEWLDLPPVPAEILLVAVIACIIGSLAWRYVIGTDRLDRHISSQCWCCAHWQLVEPGERNAWTCVECRSHNGFAEDGGYAFAPPEMFASTRTESYATPRTFEVRAPSLCPTCTSHQAMIIQLLADIDPNIGEGRINAKREALEKRYPLCALCLVRAELAVQDANRRAKKALLNTTIAKSADSRRLPSRRVSHRPYLAAFLQLVRLGFDVARAIVQLSLFAEWLPDYVWHLLGGALTMATPVVMSGSDKIGWLDLALIATQAVSYIAAVSAAIPVVVPAWCLAAICVVGDIVVGARWTSKNGHLFRRGSNVVPVLRQHGAQPPPSPPLPTVAPSRWTMPTPNTFEVTEARLRALLADDDAPRRSPPMTPRSATPPLPAGSSSATHSPSTGTSEFNHPFLRGMKTTTLRHGAVTPDEAASDLQAFSIRTVESAVSRSARLVAQGASSMLFSLHGALLLLSTATAFIRAMAPDRFGLLFYLLLPWTGAACAFNSAGCVLRLYRAHSVARLSAAAAIDIADVVAACWMVGLGVVVFGTEHASPLDTVVAATAATVVALVPRVWSVSATPVPFRVL